MSRFILLIIMFGTLFGGSMLFAQDAPKHLALREYPPIVDIEMRRPGFWISRHPAPDSVFMTPRQIDEFNRQVQRKGLVTQIQQSAPILKSTYLKRQINDCYNMVTGMSKYDQDGNPIPADFWQNIRSDLNLDTVKSSQNVRYAFPIRFTNQRLIPFSGILTRSPLDLEFDRIQNSGFDIGEPLVIYHDSRDANWVFGAGRASSGWFFKEDLVFVERENWLKYQQKREFLICTQDKSDLYLDEARTRFYGLVRLGSTLPLLSERELCYEIILPTGQSAFIAKRDAHKGFLPFTARNVYELAFSTLNAPYGWGDLNAEYDCSGLMKQIFQCFGVYLPRNGAAQYSASRSQYEFPAGESARERELNIANIALPAQTLLRMPGHIMLFLGSVEGKSYALHAIWGISIPLPDGDDALIAANKTMVSDLYLSEGSKRNSLLLRLSGIGAVMHDK